MERLINYYKTLGIETTASPKEIRKAYLKLAKKYHPDNQETGDSERFLIITNAYGVLSASTKDILNNQNDRIGKDPDDYSLDTLVAEARKTCPKQSKKSHYNSPHQTARKSTDPLLELLVELQERSKKIGEIWEDFLRQQKDLEKKYGL